MDLFFRYHNHFYPNLITQLSNIYYRRDYSFIFILFENRIKRARGEFLQEDEIKFNECYLEFHFHKRTFVTLVIFLGFDGSGYYDTIIISIEGTQ